MARIQWIFSVLMLLAVLGGCTQQKAFLPRTVDFSPAEAGQMKVVTFYLGQSGAASDPNGWAGHREVVFDLLAAQRADVLGLQAVERFQVRDIELGLPQYGAVFAGSADGRDAGAGCAIIYRRDRVTPADSGMFWFSNSPWKAGAVHWGNTQPRICNWVRLTETATGLAFTVYNLELDADSQLSRVKSTELLAKMIARRNPAEPFVVMGTFYIDMNNPAMLYLQEIGVETPCPRLVDSWQMLNRRHEPVGTCHGCGGQRGEIKMDHVLVTDTTEILEVGIDQRLFRGCWASDHFPVYATIVLGR